MQPIDGGGNVYLAFSTPVMLREIPDSEEMNAGLAAMLRKERDGCPDIYQSAVEGWQSHNDLVLRNNPYVNELMSHVGAAVLHMTSVDMSVTVTSEDCRIAAEAWGNIMRDGDYGAVHNHVRSETRDDWSGVYYVDVENGREDVNPNGVLNLLDPKVVPTISGPGKFRRSDRIFMIRPKNGLLVMFPSWMCHHISPFRAESGIERISIAFNARVEFKDEPGVETVETSTEDEGKTDATD